MENVDPHLSRLGIPTPTATLGTLLEFHENKVCVGCVFEPEWEGVLLTSLPIASLGVSATTAPLAPLAPTPTARSMVNTNLFTPFLVSG